MNTKSVILILILILFLGIFFQYDRMDGMVTLFENKNDGSLEKDLKTINLPLEVNNDNFVILFDSKSSNSVKLKDNIRQMLLYMKKAAKELDVNSTFPRVEEEKIIIALENISKIPQFDLLLNSVNSGRIVYFLNRPMITPELEQEVNKLGISNLGDYQDTEGIYLNSNLLLGVDGKKFQGEWFSNSSLVVELGSRTRLHATTSLDIPLIWEKDLGEGKIVFYNGTNLSGKTNRGLITSILALGVKRFIYPVMAIKTLHLDDFPSPIPEGFYAEYAMKYSEFYREIWWPHILQASQKYDIKCTGLIIETYNDRVEPPFHLATYDNIASLIVYGRELIKSGGELGIHGYNHQSLVPKDYPMEDLGYNKWNSIDDMVLALQELKDYVKQGFPSYTCRTYVPPSNVLSLEGREALKIVFPEIKIISAIYVGDIEEGAYIHEYARGQDGILEFPRITYDYLQEDVEDWELANGITSLGVFAHFVHPDDFLDPERNKGHTWEKMYKEFSELLKFVYENHNWLRSSTLSEAGEYLVDYLDSEYGFVQKDESMKLYCNNFKNDLYYILRTTEKIKSYSGCQVSTIGKDTYLLQVSQPEVNIIFEGL